MATLAEAFAKLGADSKLASDFKANPKKVLEDLGVDTSAVRITETGPASEMHVETATVCVTAGAGAGATLCVSVG